MKNSERLYMDIDCGFGYWYSVKKPLAHGVDYVTRVANYSEEMTKSHYAVEELVERSIKLC